MKRQPRSLKNTLIEPFKQIKLGLYIIGLSLLFVGLVSGLIVNAFSEQYQQLIEIFNVPQQAQQELIQNDVFETNIARISIAMIAYVASLLLLVFWATHRFFGPLVTISRFVDAIVAGDYTARVQVRKHDELQDLAQKLNEMATSLEERHGQSGLRERRTRNGRRSEDNLPPVAGENENAS